MSIMRQPVSEQQWFTTTSFRRMLNHMTKTQSIGVTKLGRRKLRLFACGACRRMLWDHPAAKRYRPAVEASEAFADDHLSKTELAHWIQDMEWLDPPWDSRHWAIHAMNETTAVSTVRLARRVGAYILNAWTEDGAKGGKKHLCQAVREIFGNPFRVPGIDGKMLRWKDATLPTMARMIYEERQFTDLPVLADALEEAGCTDADILRHCREPGEHVRGCWVLDLLLQKDWRK